MTSAADPFDLERFVTAQAAVIATALAELRGGPETKSLDVARVPATARTLVFLAMIRRLVKGRLGVKVRPMLPLSPGQQSSG